MLNTTLCYIEQDGKYLMMHRIKKKVDVNKEKWVGIGGHFEPGENAEDCLLREAMEETGLTLTSYKLRGIVTFVSDQWKTEQMYLYTADEYQGTLTDCTEGTLEWIAKEDVYELPIWEGDKVFFRLLEKETPFFSLILHYQGDTLVKCILNGRNMLKKL